MGRREAAPAAGVAEARRLYEETTLTRADVARLSGLTIGALGYHAGKGAWRRGGAQGRTPTRIDALRAKIDREMAAAEAQIDQADEASSAALERSARTLASLVRTLRELWKFDEERARAARAEPEDDDVVDLDELRRELARRLDRLRAQCEAE